MEKQKVESIIKNIAKEKNADLVGIGQTNIKPFKSVIVIGKVLPAGKREKGFINIIPTYWNILKSTNNILNNISKYLINNGYKIKKQGIASLRGDIRPLVERAGLGSKGVNEMILNPKFGANVFYAALHTDCILEQDKRIDEVCIHCFRCKKYCPGNALTEKGLNIAKCLPYSLRACQKCLDVCPIGKIENKNFKEEKERFK